MKDDLATALRIRRLKWARYDIVDEKKWSDMGRGSTYISSMNAIKMRARENQVEELEELYRNRI